MTPYEKDLLFKLAKHLQLYVYCIQHDKLCVSANNSTKTFHFNPFISMDDLIAVAVKMRKDVKIPSDNGSWSSNEDVAKYNLVMWM